MRPITISETYQANYPKLEKFSGNNRLKETKKIVERVIPKNAKRILDIGCGNGFFINEIGKILNAAEIYGVDISKKAVEAARRVNVKADQTDVDVEDLPYKNNFFDFIFCGSLIELVLNPDRLLSEIRRTLSPKGYVIITYPNHCAWLSRIAVLLGYNPYYDRLSTIYNLGKLFVAPTKSMYGNSTGFIRLYSLRSLKQIMQFNNFKILNIYGARGETLPAPMVLMDIVFAKIPSLAFQNICLAQKK